MTNASLMHEAGHSKPGHWDNPDRWVGEGEGVVQDGGTWHPWLTHIDVWQKPSQYCKIIILQLKYISLKK